MKASLALTLAVVIGLSIFLSPFSSAQTPVKDDACQLIYARCVNNVLSADKGPIATYNALQVCELQMHVCYLMLSILI